MDSNKSYGVTKDTAAAFTVYIQKYPALYTEIADIVQKQIKKKNPVIVDVGMGPGLLSAALSKKIPESFIIGVDPVDQMVRIAVRASHGHYSVIRGVSEQLPLSTDSVDVAVSRFSLPYWADPHQSLIEMFRVLHPQGFVILDVLNKDYSKVRLALIKLHMYLRGAAGEVVRYHLDAYNLAYGISEVYRMLEKTGFFIVSPKENAFDWHFMVIAQKK